MQEEEVHIVMSDQRMPQITGVELLAKVKSRYPHAVRMLFTGFADLESIIAAINQGHIYRFLKKPWQPEELEDAVRQAAAEYDRLTDAARQREELLNLVESLQARVSRWRAKCNGSAACTLPRSLRLDRVSSRLSREPRSLAGARDVPGRSGANLSDDEHLIAHFRRTYGGTRARGVKVENRQRIASHAGMGRRDPPRDVGTKIGGKSRPPPCRLRHGRRRRSVDGPEATHLAGRRRRGRRARKPAPPVPSDIPRPDGEQRRPGPRDSRPQNEST